MNGNTHQLRVRVNDLSDTLTRKCLFSETSLDVVENLRVGGIRLVQDVLEMEVSRPKAVAEVLCEHPSAV
jgi:hypothetical protein